MAHAINLADGKNMVHAINLANGKNMAALKSVAPGNMISSVKMLADILYLTRFRTYKIARPPQTKTYCVHHPHEPGGGTHSLADEGVG